MQNISTILSILLFLAIFSMAACKNKEEETKFIQTSDGKTSPYQNVDRLIILPIHTYQGCDYKNSTPIPRAAKIDNILHIMMKSIIDNNSFSKNSWSLRNPYIDLPDEILLVREKEELGLKDLRINTYALYKCFGNNPHVFVKWETERHPSLNAVVRSSENRFYSYERAKTGQTIRFDLPEEQIEKRIRGFSFFLFNEDFCSTVKETGNMWPPPKADETPITIEKFDCD